MITCLGEALIDLMPADDTGAFWHARPGGAPMNVAVAAGRLGAPAGFVGHLSTDRFGRLLGEHLDAARVDRSCSQVSAAPTTLAVVDPGSATSEPSFGFHASGTTAVTFDKPDIDLDGPGIVHLSGSVSAVLEPAASAFLAILERHRERRLIAVDPNPRPTIVGSPAAFRLHLDRWLSSADLVKVSRADLGWIEPDLEPAAIARKWIEAGVTAVVVTRGGDGSEVHTARLRTEVQATPVTVVDTVGAGDSFMGGLLTMLQEHGAHGAKSLADLDEATWRETLAFAGRVAALACGRVGADPPGRDEVGE